jgi:hypothetical protein
MEHLEIIDFQHRELFMKSFKDLNLPVSDYTFANIYLFRKISHYQFLKTDCGLFIRGANKQGQSYVMPLNDLRSCEMQVFNELLTKHGFFFPVPEEWLSFFPQDQFTATSDESEYDYIYLTENLASLAGRKYSRHRNHLNQFFSSYEPQANPIAADNLADTMSILNQWQADSGLAREKTDFEQCSEGLEKFSDLALWGTIYYIEKEPAGFVLGEALNADTFCLHFAKASKTYHGIYEFMFNDTAKRLQSQYKYLNLEEDMGNKNLRKTKLSYYPEKLLKKYRVSRRA